MDTKIKDYTIVKTLGQGAFGKVYLVQSVDKQKYAMKIIGVNKRDKNEVRQEAKLYVSLHHQNIVGARQFFFYDEQKYLIIVAQYCPDGNFDDVIGESSQSKLKDYMIQIMNGINYLHNQKGIIHRDIKPENIMMCGDVPKIGDLGLAKLMKSSGASTKAGTLWYLAPQMLVSDKYDFSVDIWSLGIMFLEMLLGDRIYNLIQGTQTPARRNDFPSNSLINRIKSQAMRSLVLKMLNKNPQNRLKASEVLQTLSPGNKSPAKKNLKVAQSNIVQNLYDKTEEFWNNQYSQQLIKSMSEKNAQQILEQAQNNNPKACFLVGRCYHNGYGFPQNNQKAKSWFLKAKKLGQKHCLYNLYLMQQDDQAKNKLLLQGLSKNQYRSMYSLALKYLKSKDTQTINQGVAIFEKLIEQNYVSGYYLAGITYNSKDLKIYNQKKAYQFFKIGTQKGSAQCKLAYGYQQYTFQNYQSAIKILKNVYQKYPKQVQEQGGKLEFYIGWSYEQLKDYQNAKIWYRRATDKSYLKAFGKLSAIYSKQGQAKLQKQILLKGSNLKDNSDNDLRVILYNLSQIYNQQKNYSQAYKYSEKAANLGDWDSLAVCGMMLYRGDGVNQNKKKGIQKISQARKNGSSVASKYWNMIQ